MAKLGKKRQTKEDKEGKWRKGKIRTGKKEEQEIQSDKNERNRVGGNETKG